MNSHREQRLSDVNARNTTEDVYPHSPGFKTEGTSRQAAAAIKPAVRGLRAAVLKSLTFAPATPDEIARRLGKSCLSIRPRLSELRRLGFVRETGERRRNESGHRANVYELVLSLPNDGSALGGLKRQSGVVA